MRSHLLAGSAALVALSLCALPRAAHADTSFFVLDFNDGTATPAYSFELNYFSHALTVQDEIDLLAANVTNPNFTDGFQQFGFGRFYTTFGYAGKSVTSPNDFSTTWGLWDSSDGIHWTTASVGASDDPLTNGSWAAFSYGDAPPVTPGKLSAIVSASAAPEPNAALFVFGGLAFTGTLRRRTRRSAELPGK